MDRLSSLETQDGWRVSWHGGCVYSAIVADGILDAGLIHFDSLGLNNDNATGAALHSTSLYYAPIASLRLAKQVQVMRTLTIGRHKWECIEKKPFFRFVK